MKPNPFTKAENPFKKPTAPISSPLDYGSPSAAPFNYSQPYQSAQVPPPTNSRLMFTSPTAAPAATLYSEAKAVYSNTELIP